MAVEHIIISLSVGIPIAYLIYIIGWTKGSFYSDDSLNWSCGFHSGWDEGWDLGFEIGYRRGLQGLEKDKEKFKEQDNEAPKEIRQMAHEINGELVLNAKETAALVHNMLHPNYGKLS